MDIYHKPNGRWQVRWREGARRCGRTFDRKGDAVDYMAWLRRRQQLGHAAVPEDVPLCEFIETYWRLHAVPNLSQSTRDLYSRVWSLHILPRLGDYGVRDLTPKRLTRFRAELERAGVGTATVVKAMTIVQSILSFAVSEELVEYNAAAFVTKPRYERAREPHTFLPADVEQIRATLQLRDGTLVSTLAYSGPRPEEVVCRLAWATSASRRSATRTPSATAPGTRHCSNHSPTISASGSSPPADRQTQCPWSPPTTATSGTRTTGATGAHASGKVNPHDSAGTARTRQLRQRAARRKAPGLVTCAQATSRCGSTRASRSRRSAAKSARASA
ncbi:MAG: hypothetical protein ACLP01_25345 [Solirubrobacteraceae bacterium]